MNSDELWNSGLSEIQIVVLECVKKDVAGLSVREAKDVLYKALSDIEDDSITSRPSSSH